MKKQSVAKPWQISYVGDKNINHPIHINHFHLKKNGSEHSHVTLDNLDVSDKNAIHWIEVDGIHDEEYTKSICEHLGVHGVTIEDILNTRQRPKVEFHPEYVFVSLKAISYKSEKATFRKEQMSFILKDNLVLSFSQLPHKIFENLKLELSQVNNFISQKGADFLFYRLLDLIIDEYFKVIDKIDEEVHKIEQGFHLGRSSVIEDVYWLKKEVLYLKKALFPIRDIIASLVRNESKHFQVETLFFFNDTLDHCEQINESVDLSHELVKSFFDRYMSSMNKKTNEIMMYLTIFSTVFIPLTFITGIYGMNFRYMPELQTKYGYYIVLTVLFLIALSILYFFKRKKWLEILKD